MTTEKDEYANASAYHPINRALSEIEQELVQFRERAFEAEREVKRLRELVIEKDKEIKGMKDFSSLSHNT